MPSTQKPNQSLLRSFYPSLDGLRAVAFLLTFTWHYCRVVWDVPLFQWGWVGVDLFFVLSGFLITGILYDSRHREDFFKNFYTRRALRIFPLYYGFWIAMLLLTPILKVHWNIYLGAMALYVGNFFIPGAQLHLHASPSSILTGHTPPILIDHFWSLCVEEQFYMLWPAVVWMVQSRKALLRICLCLLVFVPLGRIAYFHLWPERAYAGELYYSTFARCDTLFFGAALALYLRGVPLSARALQRIAVVAMCIAPLALVVGFQLERSHVISVADPFVTTIGFTLIAVTCCAVLVLTLDPTRALGRVLGWRPLLAMGRISYGLYFFNELPFLYFATHLQRLKNWHLAFLFPVAGLAYCVIAASFSFRFLESPFLRLKDRWAPRKGAVSDPQPVSAE